MNTNKNYKDIITLETGKLAKEKGFQEEELHYYFNEELLQHPNRLYYNYNQDNPPLEQYSAPYQSFLQKWLREKYDLIIWVCPLEIQTAGKEGLRYTWVISKMTDISFEKCDNSLLGFLIYEDALEIGLKESLKLI